MSTTLHCTEIVRPHHPHGWLDDADDADGLTVSRWCPGVKSTPALMRALDALDAARAAMHAARRGAEAAAVGARRTHDEALAGVDCPIDVHGTSTVRYEDDEDGNSHPVAWVVVCESCGREWDVTP